MEVIETKTSITIKFTSSEFNKIKEFETNATWIDFENETHFLRYSFYKFDGRGSIISVSKKIKKGKKIDTIELKTIYFKNNVFVSSFIDTKPIIFVDNIKMHVKRIIKNDWKEWKEIFNN